MAEPVGQLGPISGDARGGRGGLLTSLGAVGAAFVASLCCIGPVLFVTLGVGAGLASRFEPLRPVFTVLTLGFLTLGFYVVYARKPAVARDVPSGPDGTCQAPWNRARDQVVLWIATLVALLLLTFPQWSKLFV